MKILHPDMVNGFFPALQGRYEVLLPVLLPDGTRALGSPGDGDIALHGGALAAKPTAAFFRQQETVFTVAGGDFRPPEPRPPLLVAGFTPADIACLRFIDRFFGDGLRDDLYFRRRESAVVICVSGRCGPGGALIPPAGGGCDLELVWDGKVWLAEAFTEEGEKLIAALPDASGRGTALLQEGRKEAPEWELLGQASELLRRDRVPDSFWEEIAERCIACTGCNLSCPTCTCFGVEDRRGGREVERSRMWDSCQLAGFMREASGHNPLGTEALRTRRRIHHKLAADPEKWGEAGCFLCGRCDAVCPTGIGIVAVMREMVARFG